MEDSTTTAAKINRLQADLISLKEAVDENKMTQQRLFNLLWNEVSLLSTISAAPVTVCCKDQLPNPANDPIITTLLLQSTSKMIMEDTTNSGAPGTPTHLCTESAADHPPPFVPWLDRQLSDQHPATDALPADSPSGSWLCNVCDRLATDGPPGDHFCYSRVVHGVMCNYCGKCTGRMPDLRVHFKKIVYCKQLRRTIKRKYKTITANEAAADMAPDVAAGADLPPLAASEQPMMQNDLTSTRPPQSN